MLPTCIKIMNILFNSLRHPPNKDNNFILLNDNLNIILDHIMVSKYSVSSAATALVTVSPYRPAYGLATVNRTFLRNGPHQVLFFLIYFHFRFFVMQYTHWG